MWLNKIEIIGRMGADPERKETINKHKYTRFSLPLYQSFSTDEKPNWVVCEAWNQLGEIAIDRGKKGALVYIEGRLVLQNWEADGEKRSRTYIRINNLRFLEKREDQIAEKKEGLLDDKPTKESMDELFGFDELNDVDIPE